jgi:hypothetical protein
LNDANLPEKNGAPSHFSFEFLLSSKLRYLSEIKQYRTIGPQSPCQRRICDRSSATIRIPDCKKEEKRSPSSTTATLYAVVLAIAYSSCMGARAHIPFIQQLLVRVARDAQLLASGSGSMGFLGKY